MGLTKRKRRITLWEKDPHCHWCGRLTVLSVNEDGLGFPEQATTDHLYNRLDPQRLEKGAADIQVLACYECNARRGREYQRRQQQLGNPKAFDPSVRHLYVQHLTYTIAELYPELAGFIK